MATFAEFEKIDIRVGKIIAVNDFPEARKPAYQLTIDFGEEIGIKKSSAQFAKTYEKTQLLNQLVIAVVNFPPRQIGPMMSEVLTLGVPDENNFPILLQPEREVPLGGRLY